VPDWDYSLPPEDRFLMMTVCALRTAFEAAGITTADTRAVVIIGTSYGDLLERAPADDCTLQTWSDSVTRALGLRRSPIVVSTACSSGSDALALGLMMIRAGDAEVCVCGGVDIVTDTKRFGHSSLGTLSASTLRAFDVARDGTLLGEGAAFFVLERASATGSAPLGFLLGQGAANDACTMTAPDPEGVGARLAIERALKNAMLAPNDVCAYCAHGSGTDLNEASEIAALQAVFRDAPAPKVFATKPNLGHSLGATGAVEALALLLALRHHTVPPLAGTENLRPELLGLASTSKPLSLSGNVGASLTLGFGGYDTCLILGGPSWVSPGDAISVVLKPDRSPALREIARSACSESSQNRLWPGLRRQIAFADPAAWFVAGAVESLLASMPSVSRHRIASILIDSFGPRNTLTDLRLGRVKGRISPMRFAAATPSAILAVSCIAFGLRGPALTLAGRVPELIGAAVIAAFAWLGDGVADAVILVSRSSETTVRGIALTLATESDPSLEGTSLASWLSDISHLNN
jgi:3-oxoacyl-[acyl-carrier-protein] synthase II